jgi:hypothetical protein
VPWFIRKALRHARLSLEISQTTSTPLADGLDREEGSNGKVALDEAIKPVTNLRLKQIVNPGGFDSEGYFTVDGSTQELSLPIFGDIRTQMKFIDLSEIQDDSIRQTFRATSCGNMAIQELAQNTSKGWEAEVIWGFENIDGKKYFTRNVSTVKDEKKVIGKMVYDGLSGC